MWAFGPEGQPDEATSSLAALSWEDQARDLCVLQDLLESLYWVAVKERTVDL